MNYQKTAVVLISFIICCMLGGCGKSEAVKSVEALIDGIGEVTLDSENAIKEAEEAYNSLTDKEKEQVENADQIEIKKQELEDCIKEAEEEERRAMIQPFLGNWKPIYKTVLTTQRTLLDYNNGINKTYINTIEVNENNNKVSPIDDKSFNYYDGGVGTLTLVDDNGITKLVSHSGAFVREEEYNDVLDKMFVHVVLDEDNIGDYIGGPIKIGKYTDEWGDESDSDVYTFSSPAYEDDDLIMLVSKNVKYEMYFKGIEEPNTYNEPYPIMWGYGDPKLDHFGRAEGEIWYVRSEYVSDIKEEFNFTDRRRITFTDGFSAVFDIPDIRKTTVSVDDLEF